MLEAIAEAESTGFTEQHARALNNLGGFGLAPPHHAFADTYLPQAIEFCAAHNEDLWHINALAYAARNALDRGRWAEAADFAERLLQDPRESPWPHHEALVVLALVRARRGDPGAGDALDEAEGVGVPADDLGAQLDLAARAPRSPGSNSAPAISTQRPRVRLRALAAAELRPVARASRSGVCSPVSRSRSSSSHRRPCARARRQVGGRGCRVGALRLSLRGRAGADRDERRGLAPAGAHDAAGARGSARCAARHAPTPCPRGQGGHARAAEGDT